MIVISIVENNFVGAELVVCDESTQEYFARISQPNVDTAVKVARTIENVIKYIAPDTGVEISVSARGGTGTARDIERLRD